MLLLKGEEIRKVFSMRDAIEADKTAFRLFSEGRSVVPLRVNIEVPKYEGNCLFMSGYVEDEDVAGVKIVSVFPKNIEKGKTSVPATMVLVDGTTGEVSAIMDGTTLTQMRTGAAAGAATELLARKEATIGALLGTGGQAASQLEALLVARPLKEVRVYDVNGQRAQAFAERMQRELSSYGAQIVAEADPNKAVEGADVITAVTTSRTPVFDGRAVKPGAHVNGVGCFTPEMQELDPYLVEHADRIFVDSREAVLAEAGDFIIPMKAGRFGPERITGELGEVISGKIRGRESDSQITLFKTVGLAVQDVVAAGRILEAAQKAHIGEEIVW